MGTRVDELDLRILARLQDDGRRSFTKVARDLGISEGTVRHRVGRLIRRHLLRFVADVDALELGMVMAYVLLRVRGGALMRAAEDLAKLPEVDYIVICSGSADLLLEVVCRDQDHLLRILADEIRRVPGVDQVDTLTTLRITKDSYRWTEDGLAGRIVAKSS